MNRILGWSALSVGAGLLLVGSPEKAEAHVCMDFPLSRVGEGCTARSPQKMGPCGVQGRSENVNVFRPGEVIELVLRETVDHPSHYRISFNPDGDTFPDPVAVDDYDNDYPHVLIDGIEDSDESVQTVEVELPTLDCESCTLQLIQVMYDKQDNGFGGRSGGPNDNDDIYYSCADIALRGEPVGSAAPSSPTENGPLPRWWAILAMAGCVGFTRWSRNDR